MSIKDEECIIEYTPTNQKMKMKAVEPEIQSPLSGICVKCNENFLKGINLNNRIDFNKEVWEDKITCQCGKEYGIKWTKQHTKGE